MNDKFTDTNEQTDIVKLLNDVSEQTNVNAHFVAELEQELREAHRSSAGRKLPSLKRILPSLGWALAITVFAFLLSWVIRELVPIQQPGTNLTPSGFVCPVTQPNGSLPPGETVESPDYLGNDKLWTALWPDGKVYMLPSDRETDGSFSMKWGWWRAVNGMLSIDGHRLDAEAGLLRADIPDGYGDTGFQVSTLTFPTTGCWEVTGHVGDASLTFVTEILFGEATPTPAVATNINATPSPESTHAVSSNDTSYDFRGAKLYLAQPLPDSPAKAHVYQTKKDQPATVEEARALAARFGIQGEVYTAPGLINGTTDYFITDGKQSLQVHSVRYFSYTADMAKALNNFVNVSDSNASMIIDEFLTSRGFNFAHKIVATNFLGGYLVQPLVPDGLAMEYEAFTPQMMRIKLDEGGKVLSVDTELIDLEANPMGTYDIISAQDALNQLLNDNVQAGKIEFFASASGITTREWKRIYPSGETITIYGYASASPALDSNKPSFIQIDGMTVSGNTNGMETLQPGSFVAATGKFIENQGVNIFEIASWKISDFQQDGLIGTLHRENGQMLLTTDQEQLTIQPELPADLPLPFENAFVVGVRKANNIYEWQLIDDRATSSSGGGGGGGGGGLGFYQLNLGGTPIPFPTATSAPDLGAISAGTGTYTVQAGDTLLSIANRFGITLDQLNQANHLADTNLIFVGQKLVIPGLQPQPAQEQVTDLRGSLYITIHKKVDGTQSREYNFAASKDGIYTSYQLEGSKLNELDAYEAMPILITGMIDNTNNTSTLSVDSYKILFPDLHFQILKGTQTVSQINGEVITLFTDESGRTFAQISPDGRPNNMTVGQINDPVLLETLAVPDETLDGYPALRVYSAAMAISPKNGQPVDLPITADQPMLMDDTNQPPGVINYVPPNLIIDSVELTYFVSNPYYQVNDPAYNLRPMQFLQPVWHFHGHYDNGDQYDAMIQALKQEYLKPEIAPGLSPG